MRLHKPPEGIESETVRVAWRKRDRDEVQVISGQRQMPLAVIDNEPICDSVRIIEHLRWRAAAG